MAARAVTSPELALLRTPGQWSRFWLAFYKPNTIYTARLSAVPSSTDMVGAITYSSGSGTLANVKKEMTLWVGSTSGARDLGVCRLRKAPISGTFYIDLTSEIDWQSNCYLTVVDAFAISPRTALMDDGTLKLDYEYAYSDQHEDFEPVPVLGSHAIAWLTGSTVDVEFDAGDSWVFDSTISTYSWSAPGASATSGTSTATPTLTYNATGYYTVYCTVTSAAGKSYTGIRHVFVFGSAFMPQAVELTDSPSASLSNGGWGFAVKMYADADPSEVLEGCLAVLLSEDRYGSTRQEIGQVENRENILCGGYVQAESILWDAEISEAEFSITGAHAWMGEIEIPPLKLFLATDTPASWDVITAMTVDRALWHLLHWRSNVTALMDVTLTGDDRTLPVSESEGTLWDQLSEIAWGKIFAIPFVDRFGRLYVNIDPQLTPEADRTWETVMTLTKQDWKNQIQIKRHPRRSLSMLSLSGWLADLSGTVNTLYALAMGHVYARYGRTEMIDKLLASSQSQLNTLAGLFMGWKNRELDFEIALGQNNRMIDLFPPQYLAITLEAVDTPRGIAYDGNLIPRSVRLEYDASSMSFETMLDCEQETFASIAVDGDVPASTGIGDWDDSMEMDFGMPDMSTLPEIISLPPSVENPNHPKVVAMITDQGVIYSTNFDQTEPTWQKMNNGIDPNLFSATEKVLQVTPNGALWLLLRGVSDTLYRASGVGGTWVEIANHNTLEGLSIHGLGVNPNVAEQIAIVSGGGDSLMGPSYLYVGNAGGLTKGASSLSIRPYIYSHLVYLSNAWYLFFSGGGGFGTPGAAKLSISGTYITSADITSAGGQDAASRFGIAKPTELFEWDAAAPGGFNIIVPSTLVPTRSTLLSPAENVQGVAFSPTGNYAMGASRSPYTPYLSTDGGASWSSVAGVLSTGSDIWENCKDDNRWIFGGGTTIKLTVDRGASYVSKAGNLGYIAPLVDIQGIRFIS